MHEPSVVKNLTGNLRILNGAENMKKGHGQNIYTTEAIITYH